MTHDVPFGNSIFQITNFTDGRETPQRRYRHCLLQLYQKENAMKECKFRRRRCDIDIKEIKEKLQSADGLEKDRLLVDLDEKEHFLNIEMKMIEDCVVEIAAYRKILEGLPEFTREEFETAEQDYWEKRLLSDARREMIASGTIGTGTIKSLEAIGVVTTRSNSGEIAFLGSQEQIK